MALLPEDAQARACEFRQWRRQWLPGYALVGRDDLLAKRLTHLQQTRPDAATCGDLGIVPHSPRRHQAVVQEGLIMIRIALIDDHELVRTGYRLILSAQPDIEIVGEAEDGQAGLQLLKRLEPDVALVDVQMPGLSGIEVTDRARWFPSRRFHVVCWLQAQAAT